MWNLNLDFFWKKVKSPISMRNETFNTSKCRGNLQKMGVLYTHSPKSPGPFPQTSKKKNLKNKIISKKKGQSSLSRYRPMVGGRLLVAGRPWADDPTTRPRLLVIGSPVIRGRRSRVSRRPAVVSRPQVNTRIGQTTPFFWSFLFSYPLLFAQVVNSC
jgi:hypothetical protein